MANFLDLALELREQIYHYLLHHPPPDPHNPNSLTAPATPLHPAILAVNKQIHAEALPILYAHNTFRSHPTLLTSFPSLYNPTVVASNCPQISESTCPGVRLIRRWYLKARLDCGPFWTAERVAEAFTGVDELTVEVWQSMYGGGGGEVLRLFGGVRGVKKVRIWGEHDWAGEVCALVGGRDGKSGGNGGGAVR
ncbi:hypothetical protein N0V93_006040 [Gnomoniopsis smithogilvyi]|uniref:Uncharacterized protein n=1 Tax=Gnomoniopsis smithogilvyi TaxID=1191159 RepID=A0A9W9CVC1_9PEZI|nr:hypothetical protein N0V93_006040 [Gnomoniopsis smithogilvyi]